MYFSVAFKDSLTDHTGLLEISIVAEFYFKTMLK